jgi:hypothetical protein
LEARNASGKIAIHEMPNIQGIEKGEVSLNRNCLFTVDLIWEEEADWKT